MMILLLLSLHQLNLLPILGHLVLLVSDQVTHLHLLFNQVLGLGEGSNEFFLFFFLHAQYFVLVSNVNSLEILLFKLEFKLFVTQLFPETLLLLVQM